ncbi:MAG: response regulator transcription factor [Thiobacillus sp.]|nr:response regulator transcription factor [Thiobacillus sp.]
MTYSLLLIDDHPALRTGLRSLLSGERDISVITDLASGEEAYAWYRTNRPDVVVMDISMAGYGGLEALRHIVQFDPQARVLVYTVHDSEIMLHRALALGALGYVTKGSSVEALIQGIREVARGRGYVSPDMIHGMVRKQATRESTPLEELGHREFQILLLTAQGKSALECARILSLSEKTVRNHLTRIKAKLKVADTAGLTRMAIRMGVITP